MNDKHQTETSLLYRLGVNGGYTLPLLLSYQKYLNNIPNLLHYLRFTNRTNWIMYQPHLFIMDNDKHNKNITTEHPLYKLLSRYISVPHEVESR